MKPLAKLFFSMVLLFSAYLVCGQGNEKYKIQLVDNDGNAVEFFLIGDNGTLLKSNSDGALQLTKNQLNKYKKEKFTLHFSNHLAYLVYRIDLYKEKSAKSNDKHLKYNQLTINELTPSTDNTFYLRRKEIRLDDETGIE